MKIQIDIEDLFFALKAMKTEIDPILFLTKESNFIEEYWYHYDLIKAYNHLLMYVHPEKRGEFKIIEL